MSSLAGNFLSVKPHGTQSASQPGLETLAAAVVVLDENRLVRYFNPAAENLFALSAKNIVDHPLEKVFDDPSPVEAALDYASKNNCSYTQHEIVLHANSGARLDLSCTVTPADGTPPDSFLIEFSVINQQLRVAREERLLDQGERNRELIRNLAHEIKNPLGALRGAAQLLDRELDRAELHEYTQVIIKEADRLCLLMDRLLTPHRLPKIIQFNIHEVLERVRSLITAEYPERLKIRRDYDVSLPMLSGDREQIIQALLNIARNAAQAMQGKGNIQLRTRVARQTTLAKQFHKLAILIEVIDDGPGVPESIRDQIFFPLVSGRDDGSGLGLTLAQSFISQHRGTIELESQPGHTIFSVLLPTGNPAREASPQKPRKTS